MSKFEVYNETTDRVVLPADEYPLGVDAAGRYQAALMLAGLLRSDRSVKWLDRESSDDFEVTTTRGKTWIIRVREV